MRRVRERVRGRRKEQEEEEEKELYVEDDEEREGKGRGRGRVIASHCYCVIIIVASLPSCTHQLGMPALNPIPSHAPVLPRARPPVSDALPHECDAAPPGRSCLFPSLPPPFLGFLSSATSLHHMAVAVTEGGWEAGCSCAARLDRGSDHGPRARLRGRIIGWRAGRLLWRCCRMCLLALVGGMSR